MEEVRISDTLSYIFNEYNGEWEPIFHHPKPMEYYLHGLTRGLNDTSSNEEETIMPLGKTNFDELIFIKNFALWTAKPFDIEKVIFNAPATIVKWLDGSKTVVKCGENDEYDPEKGLAMCFAKKALGNKGHYYETFKEWLPEDNLEETFKDWFLKKMMNAFESGGKTDGK